METNTLTPTALIDDHPRRIVIVGGGFVGFTLARRLERRLRSGEAEVVLVAIIVIAVTISIWLLLTR